MYQKIALPRLFLSRLKLAPGRPRPGRGPVGELRAGSAPGQQEPDDEAGDVAEDRAHQRQTADDHTEDEQRTEVGDLEDRAGRDRLALGEVERRADEHRAHDDRGDVVDAGEDRRADQRGREAAGGLVVPSSGDRRTSPMTAPWTTAYRMPTMAKATKRTTIAMTSGCQVGTRYVEAAVRGAPAPHPRWRRRWGGAGGLRQRRGTRHQRPGTWARRPGADSVLLMGLLPWVLAGVERMPIGPNLVLRDGAGQDPGGPFV